MNYLQLEVPDIGTWKKLNHSNSHIPIVIRKEDEPTDSIRSFPPSPIVKKGGHNHSGLSKREYHRLHRLMRKRIPKPEFCQFCSESPSRELANFDGIYNEEEKHWCWSCRSCHLIHDCTLGVREPVCGEKHPLFGRTSDKSPFFGKKHTEKN